MSCRSATDRAVPADVPRAAVDRPPSLRSLLATADQAYVAGDYAAASAAYRGVLAEERSVDGVDRALFRLAILRLLPDGSEADPEAGMALLARLLSEHPNSSYRNAAQLVARLATRVEELESETQRLAAQLEALKRIDLDRDRSQRSP